MACGRSELPLKELVGRTGGLQPWRRGFHAASGLLVAWVVYASGLPSSAARWLFGVAFVAVLAVDLVRLRSEAFNRFCFRSLPRLLSPREADRTTGTAWFLLAVFLLLWLPEHVVVPALLVFSFADPAAAIVGQTWGRRAIGSGTVAGSVAFFGTTVLLLTPTFGPLVALPVAVATAAAEVVPGRLNDNFTVPIVTGVGLWVLTAG